MKVWHGINPPPRGEGYYLGEEDIKYQSPRPMPAHGIPTGAEFKELQRRVEALEDALRPPPEPRIRQLRPEDV